MRAYYIFMKFLRGLAVGFLAGALAVAIIAVFAAAAYFAFFA